MIYRETLSVFFSPVSIKSAREPCFLEDVHGHFFWFTGTFQGKFTGKWLRSRALFWTYHGHFFEVHGQKKLNVHGHFLRFTGKF